jgi:hypothetical protein
MGGLVIKVKWGYKKMYNQKKDVTCIFLVLLLIQNYYKRVRFSFSIKVLIHNKTTLLTNG